MPKILLVEDDPDNTEIVLRILRMQSFDVASAMDGPTGVAMALSEKPDLILMDMKLPNQGDGQKATRAIRAQERNKTIPIIALTAQCMPQEVDDMVKAGCSDIVAKPVNFGELLNKIRAALPST